MSSQGLPTTEKPAVAGRSLHPALYIVNWMFFSNLTILFNKWLLDDAGFRYPVILTCWHMVFATVATQILSRTTTLLDGRKKVKMTGHIYLRAVMPIGVLYSGSLVCSNLVYLHLNVAFIQMLKAAAPVAVLFISWLWGVANPTWTNVIDVIVITCGVTMASAGEIQFSWYGFMYQVGGIVFEAMRLVMIQLLLSGEDMRMDPLVSLYYYAPVCAVMNIFVAFFIEASSFNINDLRDVGIVMLVLNALVAFMLNVASVFLIGKTSGLVLTLAGILKAILLVGTSVIIWQTQITLLQFVGYTIALSGLVHYSVGGEQLKKGLTASISWAHAAWSSPTFEESRLTPLMRRAIIVTISSFIIIMLLIEFMRGNGPAMDSASAASSTSEGGWLAAWGWN